MAVRNHSLVIFTDIDGILKNSAGDSDVDSEDALQLLRQHDVPVVLCSGKTRSQLERISHYIGLKCPFICEHGAAVIIPAGYFGEVQGSRRAAGYDIVEFGRPYADVVAALRNAAGRCRIDVIGFSEMTIEDVARECNLPLMEARLAKLREYDEPFRIIGGDGSRRDRMFRALAAAGLGCRHGRHFEHVGANVDVAAGVRLLTRLYRERCDEWLTTLGFGVATDHRALLGSVDRAFALHDVGHAFAVELLQVPGVERIAEPGVAGWAATIMRLMRSSGCAMSSN